MIFFMNTRKREEKVKFHLEKINKTPLMVLSAGQSQGWQARKKQIFPSHRRLATYQVKS